MALTDSDIRLIENVFDDGFQRNFGPSFEHAFERAFARAFEPAFEHGLQTSGRKMMIEVIKEVVDPRFDAIEAGLKDHKAAIKDHSVRLHRLEKASP
jgi:hypothetical protein